MGIALPPPQLIPVFLRRAGSVRARIQQSKSVNFVSTISIQKVLHLQRYTCLLAYSLGTVEKSILQLVQGWINCGNVCIGEYALERRQLVNQSHCL